MADYVLRGTKNLISYMRTLGIDTHTARQRAAAAVNIPFLNFRIPNGVDGPSYISPKYTEAQAQALAGVLGTTVANVTTNGGQEIVG